MIGNDVVDLARVAARPPHPRFDGRVMAPEEHARLDAAADRERLRWLFWAAKEAAYKAAKQQDDRVSFRPSRFVVRIDEPAEGGALRLEGGAHGRVEHGERRFRLCVDADGERVHAVAVAEGIADVAAHEGAPAPWAARVRRLEGEAGRGAQSRAVRELALGLAAEQLGCAVEALAIVSEERVPRLLVRGAPSPLRLSLSHHGRFLAAACGPLSAEGRR